MLSVSENTSFKYALCCFMFEYVKVVLSLAKDVLNQYKQ
jgi:hypothetical protein